jgi:hypothetical protein
VLRHGNGTAADREDAAREAANSVAAQRAAIDLADAWQAITATRATLSVATKRNPEGPELSDEDDADTEDGSRA